MLKAAKSVGFCWKMAVNTTGKWLIPAVAENARRGQELEISLQRREEKNQGEATVLLQGWPYGMKVVERNKTEGRGVMPQGSRRGWVEVC